jgi:hypothetical protein
VTSHPAQLAQVAELVELMLFVFVL